jgi:integrase
MADENLIRQTLCYAVPTAFAPRRSIVTVLTDEQVADIYDYRQKASTPLELRDVAIVMLGLRMGIRGVDILKLQITDFDWKNRTVTFIQQKTRKEITLPVPIEVGNSVYQYITCGRPSSAQSGNGYVFIRHQAPYVPFSTASIACTSALKRILRNYSIELEERQGFHMTRKTFATRMLRAENRMDDIANALGHARTETAEVYLERDENRMRLCPLPFGGVL